jgi:hypothetical protein
VTADAPGGPDATLSAEVLLAPAAEPPPGTAVTSATIEQFLPDPGAAERARAALAAAGFEVGPLVGPSFSITGPRRTFTATFGDDAVAAGLDLPTHRLAADVRPLVRTVTFTPPPTFGVDA